MDIATLIADKPLLANLTREYELLKVTKASINFEEWIKRRLQLAAAARQRGTQQQTAQAVAADTHAPTSSAAGLHAPGTAPPPILSPSIGTQSHNQAASMAGRSVGGHLQQQEAEQVQYWQQHNTVQGQQPNSTSQPQWVAAARLQTSLQSSGVVPLMHAAADRDRKLAATAALVREQLALGESGISNVATWQQLFLQQQNQGQQQQQQNHGVQQQRQQKGFQHQQGQGLQQQQQQVEGLQQQQQHQNQGFHLQQPQQQDQGLQQQQLQPDQNLQHQHQQDHGAQLQQQQQNQAIQQQQDQLVQQEQQQDQDVQQQQQQEQSLRQQQQDQGIQQQQDQGQQQQQQQIHGLHQQQHYVTAKPAIVATVAAVLAGSEDAAAAGPQQWPQQKQQVLTGWPVKQPKKQQTTPVSRGTEPQLGLNTAGTMAVVAPWREDNQQQQQQEQQHPEQHQQQQTPGPEAVRESWLLKSVLQPNNGKTAAKQFVSGKPPAPDFIRITGEAGSKPIKHPKQTPQQQQQQQGLKPGDRRSQLKAALKQLISSNAGAGLQQRQVVSVLQSLLGVEQQQQQGMLDGEKQQIQQVAVLLQNLLQGLGSKDSKQDERRQGVEQQDENAAPWDDLTQQEHSPFCDSAKQQLLHRQQHRQQQKLQKAAAGAAAGAKSPQQQHQEQRQRAKPAWQSDVYVPPPVQLLKRKNGGFADVWGQPIERKLPPVRPSSAAKPGRHRQLSAKTLHRPVNKPARQQQRQQQRQQPQLPFDQHTDLDSDYAAADGAQGLEHGGAQEQQLFVDDLLIAATRLSYPSGGGPQHGLPSRVGAGPSPAAAAVPEVRQSAAGMFAGLSAGRVQEIEQQVQQQLHQQKQQQEAARLSRLEQTASHILGVVARLEQQLQQPQAGLPAIAATSTAAERDSPVTTPAAPTASVPATAAAAPAAEAAVDSNQLQDPAVLSDLLRTLEQLEAQEQEICNRWFGSGEVPAVPVGRQSTQVAVSQAPEVHPSQQTALQQAPITQATDTANDSSSIATLGGESANELQQQRQLEPLSKDTIRSVKSGRRRFLKHQALVDGNLEVLDADSPSPTLGFRADFAARDVEKQASRKTRAGKQQLQPTLVVEAVADLLLDELMTCQVKELEGFMDTLCNQLFEDEFRDA